MSREKVTRGELVWLDLEFTHSPGSVGARGSCRDSILECAVVVTTSDLDVVAESSWVVSHPVARLTSLPDWHQQVYKSKADGGNGLFDDVLASDITREKMESELMELLRKHCVAGQCRLAGNSVHVDREVLLDAMPCVYHFFHHQILDISTLYTMMRMWRPEHVRRLNSQCGAPAPAPHRALEEVYVCIQRTRIMAHMYFS